MNGNDKPFDENEPLIDGDWPVDALRVASPGEGVRDAIFLRTTRSLRKRVRCRRAAKALVVVVAFAAGVGTMRLLDLPQPARSEMAREKPAAAAGKPLPSLSDEVLVDAEQFAVFVSTIPRDRRSIVFKEAGDRLLNDYGDVEGALHCYRAMLVQEPETDGNEACKDDTWLLLALKQAHEEEKTHAKTSY
jgi:hypothetical protein